MSYKAFFDVEKLKNEYLSLQKEADMPDFWQNPANAKQINKQISELNSKISIFNGINRKFSDIDDFLELLKEDTEETLIEEVISILGDINKELDSFERKLLYSNKYDDLPAILEFHPGAGGTEAHDWAEMLLRMYTRYAQDNNYSCKIIDLISGEEAGISSATIIISGKYAYGNLKSENGVHRLIRNSPFDADGARHTSFASVNVIPEVDSTIDIEINPSDLRIDTFHASGPGGQNVNKTESAVRITHLPTNIVVSCQVERDQLSNKETCLAMLKSKLFQIEQKKREEELNKLNGVKKEISFSSQIRTYVFSPYTMVKDHRNDYSETDVKKVMDGSIQGFIDAYLHYFYKKN